MLGNAGRIEPPTGSRESFDLTLYLLISAALEQFTSTGEHTCGCLGGLDSVRDARH